MKKLKIFKKILSIILIFTTISQTNIVRGETRDKLQKLTPMLNVLSGIGGFTIACLTIGIICQHSELQKKQNKIMEMEKKSKELQLKLQTNEQEQKKFQKNAQHDMEKLEKKLKFSQTTSDELQQTWYATYYCAITGIVKHRNNWRLIAQKCSNLTSTNKKVRQNLDELLKYSINPNTSEFDFIFNILMATYLSQNLPLGTLGSEIPTKFSPGHWLYCSNLQVSHNNSENDKTFEICKTLATNIFAETLDCFDINDPEESQLHAILKTEFIDVLTSV